MVKDDGPQVKFYKKYFESLCRMDYSRAKGSLQKSVFSRFFVDIFVLVCRTVTIFLLAQKKTFQADRSSTLNMFVNSKKISRGI